MSWEFAAASWLLGNLSNHTKEIKAASENKKDAKRQKIESERQETQAISTFSDATSLLYGEGFLSKIQSGKSVSELMGSIGSETVMGKKLAEYDAQARLAVSNAQRKIGVEGTLASAQGELASMQMTDLELQAARESGAAASAQATSGIRTSGTGDNMVRMQEQQNDLARAQMVKQNQLGNQQTISGMGEAQISASQLADSLRKEKELTEQGAIQNALLDYGQHKAQMADFDASQDEYDREIKYWRKEQNQMDSVGGWLAGLFGF